MNTGRDEQDITRLLAKYCHFCDDGRFDALVECFTGTAQFVYGPQVAEGHDAIRAFYETAQTPERRGKHVTTNLVIDVDGDTATVTSDFMFFARSGADLVVRVVGRYNDSLRRDEGMWRFQRREAVPL